MFGLRPKDTPGSGLPAEWAWETVKQYNSRALDTLANGDDATRLTKLNDQTLQATLGSEYSLVRLLMAARYKMDVTPQEMLKQPAKHHLPHPGVSFIDQNSAVLPYGQIADNPKALDNYLAWLEANGRGGDNEIKFGQVVANASGMMLGKRTTADALAEGWEQEWAKSDRDGGS